jgi:electron transfer flavoprotein beta subunit
MRVLVCFKVVPDLDLLSGSDWSVDSSLRVETRFVKKIINPYDESALELALQLADQAGKSGLQIDLSALTIGDTGADLTLKTLRALGYKDTVRIEDGDELRFAPERAAAIIAAFTRTKEAYDLIIMGRQSGEGDNAQTPLLTAEMLKWPCITQVTAVNPNTFETLEVTAIADGGVMTRTIKPPCLLTVGNAPFSNLRIPTLKAIKQRVHQPVIPITAAELKKDVSYFSLHGDIELLSLEPISRKRKGIIIDGQDATEKAQILYESYLKGWLAEL